MNPLDQPVNTSSGAVAPGVPGLDPIQDLGRGAKPLPPPPKPPTKGASALQQIESVEQLLIPVAAAAGALYQPESFIGKKSLAFLTGFKVGEAASGLNKPTPGAALFLLPEPIGALPEHFFMGKPRIPGTHVYLDPLYNYTRYRRQSDQRGRDEAGAAQLAALQDLAPTLTVDQLRQVRIDDALRRQFIAYADPRAVDTILDRELSARGQQQAAAEGAASNARRGSTRAIRQALVAEAVATFLAGDVQLLVTLRDFIPNANGFGFASGGALDAFGQPIANGSLLPESIQPVNDKAKRNQDGATGIRRQLVSERADP